MCLHQIKSFYTSKKTISRLKRQLKGWGKILANYSSDKGIIFRTYKKLKKLNTK
jgi:hypothetical protein